MNKLAVRFGIFRVTVAVAALAFAGLVSLPAQATDAASAPAETAKSPSKKKTAKAAKPAINKAKFVPGSSETPAQRNTRLKRECKGAVNAGACTGYTG